MMAKYIGIPTLTESTNYELWKLQTHAWTVVTELSKEKQAVAVALRLPEDDEGEQRKKYLVNWNCMYLTVKMV